MFERLDEIEARYEEVQRSLRDPDIGSRPERLRDLGKEAAQLGEIVATYRRWKKAKEEIASSREILASQPGPEMVALARQEIQSLEEMVAESESRLKELLVPKDPNDDKDVIVEIKFGEGGEESALFVADLFRIYQHYAERRKWKIEILTTQPSDRGGFKEMTFAVKGAGAYSRLKHEAGVHRVQRVPETESQGRIHTSAVAAWVFPEAEEVEVSIDEKDLEVDVFRSSGPGGQSVNTTDSAVRITHRPTGIVVTCQDEKSQLQNRVKALRILRARLYQLEMDRKHAEKAEARRAQVADVDRSQKIRTYNFPQSRVTDHRVKISHSLQAVLEGDLDPFIEALSAKERAERLSAPNAKSA